MILHTFHLFTKYIYSTKEGCPDTLLLSKRGSNKQHICSPTPFFFYHPSNEIIIDFRCTLEVQSSQSCEVKMYWDDGVFYFFFLQEKNTHIHSLSSLRFLLDYLFSVKFLFSFTDRERERERKRDLVGHRIVVRLQVVTKNDDAGKINAVLKCPPPLLCI